jgi:hypothetical protein
MSFLSAVGKSVKAVFGWLGSSGGQKTLTAAETAAAAVGAATGTGAIIASATNLINSWINEAIKVEALASAAGEQTGSGAQKAAAVLSTMTPQLVSFLQSQGLTSDQVAQKANAINTAVVGILNTLEAPEPVS